MSFRDATFDTDEPITCPVCALEIRDGDTYAIVDDDGKERVHDTCRAWICPSCESWIRKGESYLLTEYPEYVDNFEYVHEDCRADCAHEYDAGVCFRCGFVKALEHELRPKARIK